MEIIRERFGVNKKGEEVTKYILENHNGLKVALLDLGAVIAEIWVPDRHGVIEDVVLGYDNVPAYEENKPAFGAIIGRCANRISDGRFTLNGKEYVLEQNEFTNCLHSGTNRFEHQMYQAECTEGETEVSVSFTRVSRDMEQGFPGNATIVITYTLNDADELMIEYYAVCDEDTIVSMTNHNYVNLGPGGHRNPSVLEQELQIFADEYTPIGEYLLPTGEIRPVDDTALDFREMHQIGKYIGTPEEGDRIVDGYDFNYVLRKGEGGIGKAAVYQDRRTGRRMEVYTDYPALQFYSSTQLDDAGGKDGMHYGLFGGVCLETQHFPNAVNRPEFPDVVLRAGEEYEGTAIFHFGLVSCTIDN